MVRHTLKTFQQILQGFYSAFDQFKVLRFKVLILFGIIY